MKIIEEDFKMAKVSVKINVSGNAKKLYVCGSTDNLGAWDAKKAVEVKEGVLSKQFEAGEAVEFKVLAGKSWDKVEKGAFGEEVANHSFVAAKGLVVEAKAESFNK